MPVIRFEAPKGWDDFSNVSEEARNAEVLEFFNEHLKPLIEAIPKKLKSYYGLDFARKRNACSFWPLVEQQTQKSAFLFCLKCSKSHTNNKKNF